MNVFHGFIGFGSETANIFNTCMAQGAYIVQYIVNSCRGCWQYTISIVAGIKNHILRDPYRPPCIPHRRSANRIPPGRTPTSCGPSARDAGLATPLACAKRETRRIACCPESRGNSRRPVLVVDLLLDLLAQLRLLLQDLGNRRLGHALRSRGAQRSAGRSSDHSSRAAPRL